MDIYTVDYQFSYGRKIEEYSDHQTIIITSNKAFIGYIDKQEEGYTMEGFILKNDGILIRPYIPFISIQSKL